MEDNMVGKIRTELETGISSEVQVVYAMVKIRKLMDLDPDRFEARYPMLRLCCDWCVHVELFFYQAREIVKRLDDIYPRMVGGGLSDEDRTWLRGMFSFEQFRAELGAFFAEKYWPKFSDPQWHTFLEGFLNTIQDCAL